MAIAFAFIGTALIALWAIAAIGIVTRH